MCEWPVKRTRPIRGQPDPCLQIVILLINQRAFVANEKVSIKNVLRLAYTGKSLLTEGSGQDLVKLERVLLQTSDEQHKGEKDPWEIKFHCVDVGRKRRKAQNGKCNMIYHQIVNFFSSACHISQPLQLHTSLLYTKGSVTTPLDN